MQEATNQAIENNEVVVEEPVTQVESTEEVKEVEEVDVAEDNKEDNEEENLVEGEESEEHDDPFPKKATRALERRNKKINKLRARVAELEASQPVQNEQVNISEPEGLNAPQEDDYEEYAEYLEAKGEYKANKKFADERAQATEQQEAESQMQWVQQRAKYVDDRAAEAVKTIPELDGLYRENQDIIESYSNEAKMAFLEADKPELAFYALATEGRLEELDGMSPSKIAREIALAEIRGEELSKTRPVSKAPAPIKAVRGSSPRTKTLDDMSPTQLLNHLKKSKR